MYTKSAHTSRSASLLVSALIVTLLSLGACTRSSTEPENPGSDYDYARVDTRAARSVRPQAAKRETSVNPRGQVLRVWVPQSIGTRRPDVASPILL